MSTVDLAISDRIATITFKRPEALNALNMDTLGAFARALASIKERSDVSAVILTGAGEKAFIAGADIKEMTGMGPLAASHFAAKGQEILFTLENMEQVTIAAVNGFALGGGCEFSMGCDLIYASENAKFGQPEVNLGIIPGFGGTQRLMRLVGPIKAREIVFTGNLIDAQEAHRIGLVAQVFPREKLLEEVRNIAKTIVSKGPEAIHRAKHAMNEGMDLDLRRACSIEREHFALCFAHPDQKEGMAAFVEKRKPTWERDR